MKFVAGIVTGVVGLLALLYALSGWQNRERPYTYQWECPDCPMVLDAPTRQYLDSAIGQHFIFNHNKGRPTIGPEFKAESDASVPYPATPQPGDKIYINGEYQRTVGEDEET